MASEHEIEIRVRYSETDAMGFLHHSNYFNYYEMGRTELFRSQGGDYRQMEADGRYFVVVSLEAKYRHPARYDDLLKLVTRLVKVAFTTSLRSVVRPPTMQRFHGLRSRLAQPSRGSIQALSSKVTIQPESFIRLH